MQNLYVHILQFYQMSNPYVKRLIVIIKSKINEEFARLHC